MLYRLLSYPRSLIGLVLFIALTLVCSALEIFQNFVLRSRKVEDALVFVWARAACILFGVSVEVHGTENIPSKGCVYVFNHSSFFDIFTMFSALGSFRFGAKIELFSIPVFGAAMRRAGILPIARDRKEEVFKVYKEAESRILAGERFALAPEGTRQEKEQLGAFKAGPFIFAMNANAPIVPVVVRGAAQIMPKGNLIPNWGVWSRVVHIYVLPAIDVAGFTPETRTQLQDRVRSAMEPFF